MTHILRCLSAIAVIAICSGCNTENARSKQATRCYTDAVAEVKAAVKASGVKFTDGDFLNAAKFDEYTAEQLTHINMADLGNARSKAVLDAFEITCTKVEVDICGIETALEINAKTVAEIKDNDRLRVALHLNSPKLAAKTATEIREMEDAAKLCKAYVAVAEKTLQIFRAHKIKAVSAING